MVLVKLPIMGALSVHRKLELKVTRVTIKADLPERADAHRLYTLYVRVQNAKSTDRQSLRSFLDVQSQCSMVGSSGYCRSGEGSILKERYYKPRLHAVSCQEGDNPVRLAKLLQNDAQRNASSTGSPTARLLGRDFESGFHKDGVQTLSTGQRGTPNEQKKEKGQTGDSRQTQGTAQYISDDHATTATTNSTHD